MANFWGDMPEDEYFAAQGVKNTQEYFETSYGKLFTQSWLPVKGSPKGVVCLTHGYGGDTAWTFQFVTIAVAQWGYAAYAADMPGHGRSYSLPGYIDSFDDAATSLLSFYKSVREREEYKGLPGFLFGESMGGALAMLMHYQDPHGWDGIILSAPLIAVGYSMVVPWHYMASFRLLSPFIGTWQIVPNSGIISKAVRDPAKRKLIFGNPRRYAAAPRVRTRLEIDRMADYLTQNLHRVTVPFLVLHGTEDSITDPGASQKLYEQAESKDKTIKMYEGAYHSLLQGELDETRARVMEDIKIWLDARCNKQNGGVQKNGVQENGVH